jgi:hypothetical protein
MKCTCGVKITDGAIRCGACGKPTAAYEPYQRGNRIKVKVKADPPADDPLAEADLKAAVKANS